MTKPEDDLTAAFEVLVEMDVRELRRYPSTMSLHEALARGAVTTRPLHDPPKTPLAVLASGVADVDSLVCWRVAELRVAGVQAKPLLVSRRGPDGVMRYYVCVQMPDGSRESASGEKVLSAKASEEKS